MSDDLLLNNDDCSLLNDTFQFNLLELFPSHDDVLSLSKQVEHLSLEINTQGLKVEIERLRRRRLGTTLKQVRHETIPIRNMLTQLQHENSILKEQICTSSNTHASENTRLGMITYCCLSRLHQILISVIPHVPMSPNEHSEVSQLTYEFLRAVQLIKFSRDVGSFV